MVQKKKSPPKATAPKVATVKREPATTKPATVKTKASPIQTKKTVAPKAATPAPKAVVAKPAAPKAVVKAVTPAKKVAPVKVAPKAVEATLAKAVAAPAKAPVTVAPVVAATVAAAPRQQAQPARVAPAAVVKSPAPAPAPAPKPVAPAVATAAAKPAAAAPAAAAAAADASKKPVSSRHGFKTNESIVYPAHGVGRIIGIEEQEIAGISLELFVIQFEKDKMTLRVPTSKLASVGMRKLAEDGIVKKAMETLKGKARIKRTMWSRRAQEYEAKINSGDLIAIAEVVRDLFRSDAQPEQSYSERQLYEAALDRMAREIAAVDKIDERGAMQRITEVLAKSARGRRTAEDEAAAAASDAAIKAA